MKFQFYSLSLSLRVFVGILLSIICAYFINIVLSLLGAQLFSLSYQDYLLQVQTATTVLKSKFFVQYILLNQSISIFLVPAIVMTKVVQPRMFNYLGLNFLPPRFYIFIIIQVLILNIPGMNLWSSLNEKFVRLLVDSNSLISQLYEQNQKISDFLLTTSHFGDVLLNLVFMALVPAICEEFFFRGMLQKSVVQSLKNPHIAIVLTSIIFSLMHADMYNFVTRFAMGIIFGYLYEYTKSLWIPIIAHFTHNAMVVFVYYVIQRHWVSSKFQTFGEVGNGMVIGILSVFTVAVFIKLLLDKYIKTQDL